MSRTVSLERWSRPVAAAGVALLMAAITLPAHGAGVSWRLPQIHLGVSWQRPARLGTVDPAIAASTAAHVKVVVQGLPGHEAEAKTAVEAVGGTVGADLPIVNGFAATMSPAAATRLARSAPVVAITLDRTGHFEQFSFDDTTTAS